MKRLFLHLVLLLTGVLPFQLFAQAVDSLPIEGLPSENALLWRISRSGAHTGYLFGTIHMIPEEHFILRDSTLATFDRCPVVFFELDMEQMNNPFVLFSLMGQMNMSGGMTLRKLLSPEDYSRVKTRFVELGMPISMFERMKPMFTSMMMSEDMQGGLASFGGSGMKSYELELTERAKNSGKDIRGLETFAFQMSMFDSIPYDVQAKMLVEALEPAEDTTMSSADVIEQTISLYLNQDIAGMEALMQEDASGIKGYEDLLLHRRNQNWIPLIGKALNDQPTFFAVGAGHLAGEQGVIALLRKAGFMVEPVFE